jgi:hypothetical protein
MTSEKRRFRWCLYGILPVVVVVACVAAIRWIPRVLDRAYGGNCVGLRIGVICQALADYRRDKGCFPPAYLVDNDHKPMHSWRVLILPYMGHKDLYDRYDFSEPWNGPHNRLLAKEMPITYRCPADRDNHEPYATNYVAIVGQETAWPGKKGLQWKESDDALGMTIMVTEVADSDIHWMEPRDLTFSQAKMGINKDFQHGISSYHRGRAYCGLVNGTRVALTESMSPELLTALLKYEPRKQGLNAIIFGEDGTP